MVMTIGIYSLIIISLKLNADNAFFIEATEIANQKMEQIRNLSYDDVGVTTGFPSGVILEDETISRGGTYNVHTSVIYFDDPYDGEAGTGDIIFADYKIATINVSWNGRFSAKDITVFSKIIPATEETTTGYGLLKIFVVDSNGAPVPNPDISIENTGLSISMTITADNEGKLSLPLPPSFEGYEITVTKANYGTDKTYQRDLVNLNPSKPYISIIDGLKTEESFSIDKLSLLSIKTLANTLPINFNVNNISSSTANSAVSASSDSNENIYIAWQNSSIATSTIYVQKLNSSYSAQWPINKSISNTSFQQNPDITTSSNGNSFVVWQDNSSLLKAIAFEPRNKYAKATSPTPALRSAFKHSSLLTPNYINDYFSTPYLLSDSNPYKINLRQVLGKPASAASGLVSLVALGAGNSVTGRYITLATPAGVIEDDLLIAFIHHDDHSDGPMIPPSGEGWNTLDNNMDPSGADSNSRGGIFWKLADASESSNHTFYLTKIWSEAKAGHIRAYRGVNIANPFDGLLAKSTTPVDNQYHSAPSKTVNSDGSMLVCGWGADTYTLGNVSGGPTFPAGMSNTVNTFASTITAAVADMPVNISDSPTGSMTYNARKNVTRASMDWCLVIQAEITPDDIIVSSTGNQTSNLVSPSVNQHIGGTFVFTNNTSAKLISDITISENGNINATLDTDNIKLFYDKDISAPYDCQDEQYDQGLDSQFGVSTSFDAADGKASFNEALGINVSSTESLCIYPVLDILSSANKGDIIEIMIEDPSSEITIDTGVVAPNSSVELSGSTVIVKPAVHDQIHYKFRDDDNDEINASWKTNQDSPGTNEIGQSTRLRIEISNEGDISSSPTVFSLEYGEMTSTCSAIATWVPIPSDSSKHWELTDSIWYTDNSTTTNISDGLSDENTNFKFGYMKDANNQTPAFSLASDEFTELEFNIKATTNANDSDYCFRLTDNGVASEFRYSEYPIISIVGDNNIYILGLDSSGSDLWAIKKVNSDIGNADQKNPQIANTESLGIATSVIAWEDERDGNYNIYANSIDANRNKLWSSDLQITSSSTDENSLDIVFDSQNEFIVVWLDDSSGNNDIYANKYDLDGNQVWANTINISKTSFNEFNPKLGVDSSDNIYIAYSEDSLGVLNSKITKLSALGSEIWTVKINIDGDSFNQFDPSITLLGTYLYTSWTDQREGNNDVFSQKLDLLGNLVWTSDQRINVNTGTFAQDSSFLVTNSNLETLALWRDNRDAEYNIYAAEMIDPNSVTSKANMPLIVSGTKKIGENPVIYEYDNYNLWTDGSGDLDILLEWDSGYSIDLNSASTSFVVIKREPIHPLELLADSVKTILLYVE